MCADKIKNGENISMDESKNKKSTKVKKKKETKKDLLQEKYNILEDKHLRLKAEFENYRKRKEKEILQLFEYDGLRLIENILPIVDDFDRMLHATDSKSNNTSDELLKEGAEMVFKKIVKFLEDAKVIPFGNPGELVNPELHDAMMTKNEKGKKDGEILEIFEKGYYYKERVIRHAKVIVNKK